MVQCKVCSSHPVWVAAVGLWEGEVPGSFSHLWPRYSLKWLEEGKPEVWWVVYALSRGLRPPGAPDSLCSDSIHVLGGAHPKLANASPTTGWERPWKKERKLNILVPLMVLFSNFLNKGSTIPFSLGLTNCVACPACKVYFLPKRLL